MAWVDAVHVALVVTQAATLGLLIAAVLLACRRQSRAAADLERARALLRETRRDLQDIQRACAAIDADTA